MRCRSRTPTCGTSAKKSFCNIALARSGEGTSVIISKNQVACVMALALAAVFGPGSSASAQAPAAKPAPAQGQPWGLPPPPPGVGPVSLFADIHDQPQGKFLEGGAFDDQGNFWFVAIATGWVSYLTPDAKLVPAFNCNAPPETGIACEPQGTRWH